MSSMNYMMVTVASCDISYKDQALQHIETLAADLKTTAGALTTRYGAVATGEYTGSLILFQGYEELNGIDHAFKVYTDSSDYQALISSGKLKLQLRNILKFEALQLSKPSPDTPKYGILTRFESADLMLDRMQQFVPLFEDNGALTMRYATIMTGDAVGKRLLGATYPSMDAVEKTYDALLASSDYKAILGEVDLNWRNIIRFFG